VNPRPSSVSRLVGAAAPSWRRLVVSAAAGLVAWGVAAYAGPWQLASLVGWDVAALTFLAAVWGSVLGFDGERTAALATTEDDSRHASGVILVVASTVSLVGVGLGLSKATRSDQPLEVALMVAGVLSVVESWALVHTVFTLRYAHLYYDGPDGGVDFPKTTLPDYRDFAYLAFTIGMCYQVSDTDLVDRSIRRVALRHAFISYLFGTVIIATTINIVATFVV
jgi:uncharacterized membrane protein